MQSKIKLVALKSFAENGYEHTTMRELGKEVGIKGASLYSHFGSKEEIFMGVVDDFYNRLDRENILHVTYESAETPEIKQLLMAHFIKYYRYFANNRIDLQFLLRIRFFPPIDLNDKYQNSRIKKDRTVMEHYMKLFQCGIETKQLREQDINMIVMAFFSFISGYTDSLLIVPYQLTEKELITAFDIFWEGICY